MKKSICILYGTLLVVTAALQPISASAQDGITSTTIKIGTMGALSGPLAPIIVPQFNAIEAVFEEANAAGGIHGRKILFVREDDEWRAGYCEGAVHRRSCARGSAARWHAASPERSPAFRTAAGEALDAGVPQLVAHPT